MKPKLNIFDVIKNITSGNIEYYDNLEPELQSQIQPFVLMRWLSGSSADIDVLFSNLCVNKYVFSLQQHKPLMWRLLIVAAETKNKRVWIPPQKHKSKKPMSNKLVCEALNCSPIQGDELLTILTLDQLIEAAIEMGWQQSDITALQNEHKK